MADIVVQFRGTIYEKGYGQIAQKVMRDKAIHAVAKAIYAYMVSFAGQEGSAFPSVELMMDELGIKSDDTFYKYRKQLTDAGYITIEQQQRINGRFYNNVYTIELVPTPKNIEEEPNPKKSGAEPYPKFSGPIKSDSTKWGNTNNSSSQISSFNNYQNNNKEEAVVVDEKIQNVVEEVEQHLGASVTSLLPLFAQWIKQYGEQYLIERAEFAKCKAKTNVIGLFRTTVEKEWDIQKLPENKAEAQRDSRYSSFYQLFPDA